MRKWITGVAALFVAFTFIAADAQAAKRLGGGGSIGAQRSVAKTPPAAAPAKPAQQAGQSQAAPAQGQPGAAAPQPASGFAKWAPLLGGLALGGALGWLMGANGMGGLMVGLLLAGLAVFAVIALVRMLGARNAPQRPLQYAGGMGNETVAAPPPSQAQGFDAPGAAAPRDAEIRLPAGFDAAAFLKGAKMNYMKLQMANDRGDLAALEEFTRPELFEELKKDVLSRAEVRQQVDVMNLNADLLEVVTEGDTHWASVRFSGMMRENPSDLPVGFEEVWNLAKPADGSAGWQLAGIQQMH